MNPRSPEMHRLMTNDPALAARVALWESCGLFVQVYLLNEHLKFVRGAA